MLEFLKDCDSNNIYALAHDCEINLNASAHNSVTPIAIFFENTLKGLYSTYISEKCRPRDLSFDDLLKTKEFKDGIRRDYGFSEFKTVDRIRKDSNKFKHENSDKVSDDTKREYFRCLFSFCASYYSRATGKAQPLWDEELYNHLIIDEQARAAREKENEDIIRQLTVALKEAINRVAQFRRNEEKISKQLRIAQESAMNPAELQALRDRVAVLEEESTNNASQKIVLERRLRKAEADKADAQRELQTLQSNRMNLVDFEERQRNLQQRYAEASSLAETLQAENEGLARKLQETQDRLENSRAEYEASLTRAENEQIAELREKLAAETKRREDAEHKLSSVQEELSQNRAELYYSNSELDQLNQEFLADRDRLRTISDQLPHCPKCDATLTVGQKDNDLFWKCPAWRKNGSGCVARTRTVTPQERPLAEALLSLIQKGYSLPPDQLSKRKGASIEYSAYPYSFEQQSTRAFLFQSLAVPPALFAERDQLKLPLFSKFLLSTDMSQKAVPPAERTIYSIALRLLNRGIVLPEEHRIIDALKDKFNKESFGRINSLFEYIRYSSPEYTYDSPLERKFAEQILPSVLGPQWATYTLTQVGFDVLLPQMAKNFAGQRADFLIQRNGKKIIVEIDKSERYTRAQQNNDRDFALYKAGYTVLRFKDYQIGQNDPRVKQQLSIAVGQPRRAEFNIEMDDRYIVACKLMHQLSISIVKLLEQGIIGKDADLYLDVSTDMFSAAEQQFILALAVEEVQDILEHYGNIYATDISLNLRDNSAPRCLICVGEGTYSPQDHVLIRDCVLPLNAMCNLDAFGEGVLPQNCEKSDLEFFLQYLFGYSSFRDGQFEAIKRLLMRKDSIILLPTGAGKSIVYQLSSFIAPGMIVVISPLRSLMEDQVTNLDINRGITNAIMIRSEVTAQGKAKKAEALQLIKHNSTSLLYISPERLQIPSFRRSVKELMHSNRIFAVAIDEAHCLSEWGHDFRPAYLNVANVTRTLFKKGNFVPAIIALTGTASDHVLQDVKACLTIKGNDAIIRPASFDREELHYSIVRCSSRDKDTQIASIIKNDLPGRFGINYEDLARLNGTQTYSGIVFTPLAVGSDTSQYDALNITQSLRNRLPEMGIACYFSTKPKEYDDETWAETIRDNAERFKKNQLNLLVATKAFGMGIDKSNVRFIVHNGIPASLEEYYQEAGRAGRGRDVSQCVLVFSDDQAAINEPLLDPDLPLEKMKAGFAKAEESDERDDLNAILYFHTSAYEGVENDCRVAQTVLEHMTVEPFRPGIRRQYRIDKKDDKKTMQALMRLITLGIVQDYTYDHYGCFELIYGSLEPRDIAERYIAFVRKDNVQRVGEAERAMQSIQETSGIEYAISVVRILIEYIYDNVEKSRRAATRLMYTTAKKAASMIGKEQEQYFKSAILSYLSPGEKTHGLQSLLTADSAGLESILQFLPTEIDDREYSETEHQKFRETSFAVGRMLESTPDHPSLLMLRGLCDMILNPDSIEPIANDVLASIRFARDRYSVDEQIILREGAIILDRILGYYPGVFDLVIRGISQAGIPRTRILSEMLLADEVSDEHRNYLLTAYMDEKLQEAIN